MFLLVLVKPIPCLLNVGVVDNISSLAGLNGIFLELELDLCFSGEFF